MSQTNSRIPPPIKNLFATNPNNQNLDSFSSRDSSEHADPLMNRLGLDHDVDLQLKNLQKEQHEQRMKQLRQLGKSLDEDAWRYESADQLIGLH